MKYEIRDQFDYKLGIVTADTKEKARTVAKKRYKRNVVHVIKRQTMIKYELRQGWKSSKIKDLNMLQKELMVGLGMWRIVRQSQCAYMHLCISEHFY